VNALREKMIDQFGKAACPGDGLFPADIPLYCVLRAEFNEAARSMNYLGARLAGEWASDETPMGRGYGVYACYNLGSDFLIVKCEVPVDDPKFPSIKR
jgi:hypothetical protein